MDFYSNCSVYWSASCLVVALEAKELAGIGDQQLEQTEPIRFSCESHNFVDAVLDISIYKVGTIIFVGYTLRSILLAGAYARVPCALGACILELVYSDNMNLLHTS